ncbi:MAG: SPFH domain-containing protein [Planctomycetota bacterium]
MADETTPQQQDDPPRRPTEASVRVDDPAQQSLSDALRVSFLILRVLMIALVIVYVFFSGNYQVGEQEEAVVTRFGKIITDADGVQTKERGFHFGLPYPIDNVIKVPTNERTIDVPNAFYYEGEAVAGVRPLNPEKDGSLITGDANIVHARFAAGYVISDPVAFLANFGDPKAVTRERFSLESGGEEISFDADLTGLQIADALVTNMVEQGVVHQVGNSTTDDIIAGSFPEGRARQVAQARLDELDVGITITNITMRMPEVPPSVADAYQLVSQAEATRATRINEAESERTRLLGEAGGKAALPVRGQDGPLVRLLKEYELATTLDDTDRLADLDAQLGEALRSLTVAGEDEPSPIGGETATIINNAQIEKSQIVQRLKTEAQTVTELREVFGQDPELFKQRRWQYVLREIFNEDSGIELFYAPAGQRMLIEMNRDPQITRTKERQRLQDDLDAQQDE